MKEKLKFTASMLIWATLGLCRRYLPVPSGFLALARGLGGAAFLILFMVITKKKLSLEAVKKNLILLLLSGIAMGINWVLLFEAYEKTSLATAQLCYYTEPVIVILLSPLLFKERMTLKKSVCSLAAVIGMVLITGFDKGNLSGILFGLGAACFYASVTLMNKKITDIDPYSKTAVQLAAGGIVMLPYTLLAENTSFASFTWLNTVLLIVICAVHTGIAFTFFFGALPHIPAQTAAVYSYIDPIASLLISALFLKEPLTAVVIVGGLLILGGAFFNDFEFHRKKDKTEEANGEVTGCVGTEGNIGYLTKENGK